MILARLLSATPNTDGEHWDLQFRFHKDIWHTDAYAQNPAPYQKSITNPTPNRPPYPWRPNNFDGGSIADLNGRYGFKLAINTSNSPMTLDITGTIPANVPGSTLAPQCPLQATGLSTGGTIPSGTYFLSVAASIAGPAGPYFITAVIPPGTSTGSIVISGVIWGDTAPAITLFAGTSALTMHSISAISWTGSAIDSYGNPTTFTIGAIDEDGFGLPDPVMSAFLLRAKPIVHGGVWGSAPTSIGTSGGFATATFAGQTWTTNQWAGYTLSCYDTSGSGGGTPYTYGVTSNTADTLTLNVLAAHGPTVGMPVVMRAKASSITSNTIGDANFVNSFAPLGLTVNAEAGNLIRIIAGTGAWQPLQTIASNTGTVFTIAGTWTITPDSTSVFIVEAPQWLPSTPTAPIVNAGISFSAKVGSIQIVNFQYGSLLVQALTIDANGNPSVERYAPLREVWVPPISVPASGGYFNIPVSGGVGLVDAANGLVQVLNLPNAGSLVTLTTSGTPPAAGTKLSLFVRTPTSGTWQTPAFRGGTNGFASDVAGGTRYSASPIANTQDELIFTYHGAGSTVTLGPSSIGGAIT